VTAIFNCGVLLDFEQVPAGTLVLICKYRTWTLGAGAGEKGMSVTIQE